MTPALAPSTPTTAPRPARRPHPGTRDTGDKPSPDMRPTPGAADSRDPGGITPPGHGPRPPPDSLATRRATPDPTGTTPTEDELRDLLPALEPERRLTDRGSSERIEGLFDRVVADFFYHL